MDLNFFRIASIICSIISVLAFLSVYWLIENPRLEKWKVSIINDPSLSKMTLDEMKRELRDMDVDVIREDCKHGYTLDGIKIQGFVAKFPFSKGWGLYIGSAKDPIRVRYAICLDAARKEYKKNITGL